MKNIILALLGLSRADFLRASAALECACSYGCAGSGFLSTAAYSEMQLRQLALKTTAPPRPITLSLASTYKHFLLSALALDRPFALVISQAALAARDQRLRILCRPCDLLPQNGAKAGQDGGHCSRQREESEPASKHPNTQTSKHPNINIQTF